MTAGLTPTEMHQSLDSDGLLLASHNAGVYAIRCNVPDSVEGVQRRWIDENDLALPDRYAEQLSQASRCVYVGASGDVYGRLQSHANGEVRKSSFVQAFPPVAVLNVTPHENPFEHERTLAYMLSGEGTVCWTDGDLIT